MLQSTVLMNVVSRVTGLLFQPQAIPCFVNSPLCHLLTVWTYDGRLRPHYLPPREPTCPWKNYTIPSCTCFRQRRNDYRRRWMVVSSRSNSNSQAPQTRYYSFIFETYEQSHLPWVYGGEYDAFARSVVQVVRAWVAVGLRVYFVFDGRVPYFLPLTSLTWKPSTRS